MGDKTGIEWTNATWNPTTGCDRVSPGCDHCYALTLAARLKGMGQPKYQRDGDPRTSGPGFGLTTHADTLDMPLRWTRPRMIFVNSMSDLFHDAVPTEFIAEVFAIMALARQHTFQVLTKRHGRMRSLLGSLGFREAVQRAALVRAGDKAPWLVEPWWPLRNAWLGVSVESQKWADIRVPALLDTPAAVRFLSCEPLLGPVDLSAWLSPVAWPPCWDVHSPSTECGRCIHPEWVIVGGESGPGARPMHPDWARSLRDQCVQAGVPFHFKQHGEWAALGPLYAQGDTDDDQDEMDEAHWDAVSYQVEERREVVELESTGHVAAGYQPMDPRTWLMVRLGKRRTGRKLDGRTWDEYPTVDTRAVAPYALGGEPVG